MLSNEVFDQVYTLVKEAMRDIEKKDEDENVYKPYEDLNYSRSIRDDAVAEFPCLAIRQLGAPTVGNDLERNTQNAVDSTFQLDSYSNVSYDEAYIMMNDAGELMQKLGYSLTYGPEEVSTMTYWRFVTRFNRIVGANDVLTI